MTDGQWESLVDRIEQQFGIDDHGETPEANGGTSFWYEFITQDRRMKVVRTVRPRLVGESTIFAKRIGASVAVRKVYDEKETVDFITLYRWDDDTNDWVAMGDAGSLF